jgi:hypothetical protein
LVLDRDAVELGDDLEGFFQGGLVRWGRGGQEGAAGDLGGRGRLVLVFGVLTLGGAGDAEHGVGSPSLLDLVVSDLDDVFQGRDGSLGLEVGALGSLVADVGLDVGPCVPLEEV